MLQSRFQARQTFLRFASRDFEKCSSNVLCQCFTAGWFPLLSVEKREGLSMWGFLSLCFPHCLYLLWPSLQETLYPVAQWKFCMSRYILIPHYHMVNAVIFVLDYLLVTYPWYGSMLMSGTEQEQTILHLAMRETPDQATSKQSSWETCDVLKSPGQSLSHNYLTAHLENKRLSEWFITLCHSWVLGFVYNPLLMETPKICLSWEHLLYLLEGGICYILFALGAGGGRSCLGLVCVLICVDWDSSWLWNKMRFVAIL